MSNIVQVPFSEARTYVEVPPPVPHRGGTLQVANIIPGGSHGLMGAEYITDACADGGRWDEICYNVDQQLCDPVSTPAPPAAGYKLFEQPDLVQGSPIAVHAGTDCGLETQAENEARARRMLEFTEGVQLDFRMVQVMTAEQDSNIGAMDIVSLIGTFDDMAFRIYGGYGIIWLTKATAVYAHAERAVVDSPDGGMMTVNGTRIAALVTEGVVGGDSEAFVTGQVSLIQGDVMTMTVPPVTRPDGTCDPQRALAERMYVPLIECFIVGGTATRTPTPPAT